MASAQKKNTVNESHEADAHRGIQNVQVKKVEKRGLPAANDLRFEEAANDPIYEGAPDNDRLNETRANSVTEQFKNKDSIAAQAHNQSEKRAAEAAQQHELMVQAANEEAVTFARAQMTRRQILIQKTQALNMTKLSSAKKFSSLRNWSLVGVAITIYFWQFTFSAVSLFGIGLQAVVADFAKNNVVGKIISFFVDIEKYFPGQYVGYAFWGLSTILAIGLFIAYLLYFTITGTKVFTSSIAMLITFMCLSFSFMPGTNLFPWLVLWVIYINVQSIYSAVRTP